MISLSSPLPAPYNPISNKLGIPALEALALELKSGLASGLLDDDSIVCTKFGELPDSTWSCNTLANNLDSPALSAGTSKSSVTNPPFLVLNWSKSVSIIPALLLRISPDSTRLRTGADTLITGSN